MDCDEGQTHRRIPKYCLWTRHQEQANLTAVITAEHYTYSLTLSTDPHLIRSQITMAMAAAGPGLGAQDEKRVEDVPTRCTRVRELLQFVVLNLANTKLLTESKEAWFPAVLASCFHGFPMWKNSSRPIG